MNSLLQDHDSVLIKNYRGIIGLDEVGRGALAGPLVVAACHINTNLFHSKQILEISKEFKDSKKMSENKREMAFKYLDQLKNANFIHYTIAFASVEEIDALNISVATKNAFERSLILLKSKLKSIHDYLILIDGLPLKDFTFKHKSIISGDNKSFAIACASILAKVTRDRHMESLCKDIPDYKFSKNKGYGTIEHRNALRSYGPCTHHRKKFIRRILTD